MTKRGVVMPFRGKSQEDLQVLLEEAQHRFGYLSGELLTEMAKALSLSVSDVYGVATFYSFLSTKRKGRNVIRICKSLPCFLKNYWAIIDGVAREFGIEPGGTTTDGRFSFQLINCIAPVIKLQQ